MTTLFAWADSPNAPTGFGRSAKHVLYAAHEAGFEVVQLAVNQDTSRISEIPWKIYVPVDRANDPYGLQVLGEALEKHPPDLFWATFDPEVPWRYPMPGTEQSAIDFILNYRQLNPCMRTLGWFPIDGGPLSDMELAMLGMRPMIDVPVTMASHVYDLIDWTLKLKGYEPRREEVEKSLKIIPHGVELDDYKIPTPEEKLEARAELGLPADRFIIAQVERNQQRKQNYYGLHVMEELLKSHPDLRDKVLLYQHMNPDEETQGCQLGYNLPQLAWRYGLRAGQDVMWPPGFLPEEIMPKIYAAADVFLSVSTGEGFQYPAWEALACGVPLVVPNNSARKAWFKAAPNAHLYACDDRSLILRGGYDRRMALPRPIAAAKAIMKIYRKPPTKAVREAGRTWLSRVADHRDVARQWVNVFKEQEEILMQERQAMGIVIPQDCQNATTIVLEHGPGLGDLTMMAPAFAAFQQKLHAEGRRLHIRVPHSHLTVTKLLSVADAVETKKTGETEEIRIHDLWHPVHRENWGEPHTHRADVVAGRLGVGDEELQPIFATIPPEGQDTTRARFIDAFGVEPTNCVGISLESSNPHRALPSTWMQTLLDGVKALDLTPVLLGQKALNCRKVGVADLTGQTDIQFLIGIIDQLGALICSDSSIMHFGGMVGTPLVPVFTLFAPESRLKYYTSPAEPLTADDVGDEQFPVGPVTKAKPGEWAQTISPEDVLAKLRTLLGVSDAGPRIIRPGDVHEEIPVPVIVR